MNKRQRVESKCNDLSVTDLVTLVYDKNENGLYADIDLMSSIPSNKLGEFMTMYHRKLSGIQQAIQIGLDLCLMKDDDIRDMNICPGCGYQDAIDLEDVKDSMIEFISSKIKWQLPKQQRDLFLTEVDFGTNLSCKFYHLRRRYNLHLGGASSAYPLTKFLISNHCTVDKINGIVTGIGLNGNRVTDTKIREIQQNILECRDI
jgi:hypothetical protein